MACFLMLFLFRVLYNWWLPGVLKISIYLDLNILFTEIDSLPGQKDAGEIEMSKRAANRYKNDIYKKPDSDLCLLYVHLSR